MEYKREFIYADPDNLWDVLLNVHLTLKRITLQQQPFIVLKYFCKYGISESTVRKLLHEKKIPSRQTVHNAKTTLNKVGLLIKKQNGKKCDWTLSPPLDNLDITNTIGFIVRCKTQ